MRSRSRSPTRGPWTVPFSTRPTVCSMWASIRRSCRRVPRPHVRRAGAAGGETAFEASLEEAYSFRPGQVQPDTGVDKSCLINTTHSPPYHFQNLIRSFVACGPAELLVVFAPRRLVASQKDGWQSRRKRLVGSLAQSGETLTAGHEAVGCRAGQVGW